MPLITLYESNKIRYEFDPMINDMILGRGGMGVVFKGRRISVDTNEFRYVAIKVLLSDLPEESIARAHREASIQIKHDNLLRMYGLLETRDNRGRPVYHVISEFIDGAPLSDILAARGRLPQQEAITIVKKTLLAINMLHEKDFIHRDIDPSNIMICNGSGEVKLIDFGIAKLMKDYHGEFKTGTIAGRFIGKVAYSSPEQVRGDHGATNKTSDIYSTGIMLYQLLCNRCPFEGEFNEVAMAHLSGVIQYDNSIVSSNLRYVIDKATSKLQRDRYQSASAFIADLEKVENGEKLGGGSSNKTWLIAIIAGSLITLALAVSTILLVVNNNNSNRSNVVDQAEYLLSVGSYQQALNLYESATELFDSNGAKEKISTLKILVPAVAAYNRSDYDRARDLFEEATRYGSADAYYYLGKMYYEGIGAPKSYDRGFEYITQAADLDNGLAKYMLGLAYKNGLGVAVDNKLASKYFEAASRVIDRGVDANNPEMLFIKGNMYLEGSHIQQSQSRAIEYLTKAANLDYPPAQYELYLAIKDQDASSANDWLKRAVDHGYPKAEYEMCIVYWNNGNYQHSLEMVQRAASKNYSQALQTLGAWYSTTQDYAQLVGLKQDNTKSHNYTIRALEADFENIGAMCDLWSDYSKGVGVNIDHEEAMKYNNMAFKILDDMSYKMDNGVRIYSSDVAQIVWNKLSN